MVGKAGPQSTANDKETIDVYYLFVILVKMFRYPMKMKIASFGCDLRDIHPGRLDLGMLVAPDSLALVLADRNSP